MRILVADDDPISRRLLQSMLVRFGHDVLAVADGIEAIAALAAPGAPRLALLDWMMPGADGLAVCRAMRQRAAHYVYVILITGRDTRTDMLEGFDAEVDDFLTKPVDDLELLARLRAGARVLALEERLLQTQEELRMQATHDYLTGLWNRSAILAHLDREQERVRREGGSLGLALADLDHFKHINDSYGHLTGDGVLRETARRMQDVLCGEERIGRLGGEEFLLILPGHEAAALPDVAERVRLAVAASPIVTDDGIVPTSVSMGIAWSDAATSSVTLLQAADEALYRAKREGRNRVARADRARPVTRHVDPAHRLARV